MDKYINISKYNLENKGNIHISWESSGHLNLLAVLSNKCIPHNSQQIRISHIGWAISDSINEGITSSASSSIPA